MRQATLFALLVLAHAATARAGDPPVSPPAVLTDRPALQAPATPAGARFPAHFEKSPQWYERGSDAIAGLSQRLIGRLDEAALGDAAGAAAWYAKAARHGDAEAEFRLGMMYGQGRGGLAKDTAQASRLLHAAAEEGHVDAQGTLGLSYLLGQGVNQSLKYAYMWISLASDVRGGASVRTRDMIARAMPQDRVPEAEALARRCQQNRFLQCDEEVWER